MAETLASVLPDDVIDQTQSRYVLKLGLVGSTFQTESAEQSTLVPVLGVSGGFFVNYKVLDFPKFLFSEDGSVFQARFSDIDDLYNLES